MISRYSRKELLNIWSKENKYKIWLNIEIAAAEAMVPHILGSYRAYLDTCTSWDLIKKK